MEAYEPQPPTDWLPHSRGTREGVGTGGAGRVVLRGQGRESADSASGYHRTGVYRGLGAHSSEQTIRPRLFTRFRCRIDRRRAISVVPQHDTVQGHLDAKPLDI